MLHETSILFMWAVPLYRGASEMSDITRIYTGLNQDGNGKCVLIV